MLISSRYIQLMRDLSRELLLQEGKTYSKLIEKEAVTVTELNFAQVHGEVMNCMHSKAARSFQICDLLTFSFGHFCQELYSNMTPSSLQGSLDFYRTCTGVKPKSRQREGQRRKTEN